MSHPLVLLSQIRKKLDSLTNEELTTFTTFFIENNLQSIIKCGIIRQLYHGATSSEVLTDISLQIDSISSKSIKNDESKSQVLKSGQYLCDMPDTLLCSIGSYLTSCEILTSWIHVNRRFLHTGMKPETFHTWEFDANCLDNIDNYPPKFTLDTCLTRLKHMVDNSTWRHLTTGNLSSFKDLQHITVDNESDLRASKLPQLDRNSMIESITLRARNGDVITNVLGNCNMNLAGKLKRLKLVKLILYENVHLRIRHDVIQQNIIDLLQAIAPLSKKEIELKTRLQTEITKNVKEKLNQSQIQGLENKIRNEINEKYEKKFDENELTFDSCSNNNQYNNNMNDNYNINNGNNRSSRLEMLCIHRCQSNVAADTISLIPKEFTADRIQSKMTNLRALMISPNYARNTDDTCVFQEIGMILLNSICNQLESLHIDDRIKELSQWKFVENGYPCAKDSKNEPWFPANVEQLCLHTSTGDPFTTTKITHFWHKIACDKFPKLKHLKICNDYNSENFNKFKCCNKTLNKNLIGLIENGLKSLHLVFNYVELRDLMRNKSKIKDFFKEDVINLHDRDYYTVTRISSKICEILDDVDIEKKMTDNYNDSGFTLKLELNVSLPNLDKINWNDATCSAFVQRIKILMQQLFLVFTSLRSCFGKRVMFGARILFENWDCDILQSMNECGIINRIIESVNKHGCMKSDDGCLVDKHVQYDDGDKLLIAVVWKNFSKYDCLSHVSCLASHMDPCYRFCCEYCKPRPWCQI